MKRFLSVFLSLLLMISIIPITELNVDAAGNYEVESNNDYSSAADVLTINNSISGKMDSTADIDMYKITTLSNGKLSLSFTHNYKDSTAYWRVMIYQYSGGKYNELSSLDIKGNSDEVIELPSVGAVSGGVYYIKVYLTASYYDLVGVSYSMVNNFTVTDYYEKEVNNSYDTATSISLNQTYSGTMNSTSDVDMYKITTSNSGKLALNFKHKYIDSSAYWRVMIYQYSGGKYNELSSLDIKGNSDEVIELPSVGAVTGGVYYIKVYLTASYYDLVGLEYSLINSFTATNYYEKEINNSYDTATSISLNQTYSGTMNSTSDVDMYKITTSNNGKLSLSFKHNYIDSTVYWRVMIYQCSGGKYNELSSLDIRGNSDEVIELPSVGAVTGSVYYIKVYLTASYYDLVGSEYSLTNSFTVTDYYEKEVNDSYDTSTQLYLNKEYNACMNRTSDKDYFKINLTSNETVNFKFSHTTVSGSSIPWKIKIFKYVSGSYTEIFSEYMYLNNGNITTTVNTSGTYYVMISTDYSSIVGVNYSVFVGINDTTKPTGSISSTNNVASSQTVTLNMSDNIEVSGYYWGTSSSYSNNAYTETSSSSVTKTISNSGTYYLTIKDTSGNLSTTYSITFYKTTLNANGGTVSPSYIITKSGNSFTFPTPSKSNYTYNGWSTSSSASSGSKSITPTSNSTYYAVWQSNITPSISLSSTSESMTVGENVVLIATTVPSNQYITWTSSNTSVATVSNGNVTAVGSGTATITAKFTYNGTTYSKTCSITVITDALLGDVNGDGIVDAADAGLISRYDAGLINLTSEQLQAGDVNKDGEADAGDAGIISRYDAGLIDSL